MVHTMFLFILKAMSLSDASKCGWEPANKIVKEAGFEE